MSTIWSILNKKYIAVIKYNLNIELISQGSIHTATMSMASVSPVIHEFR